VSGDEKPTSIWKKEISFRRRPADETTAVADAGEPTSIWKKEITLRKKAKAPVDEGPAEAPAPAPEPEPEPEPALPPAAAASPDPLLEAALEALAVPVAAPEPPPAPVRAVPPAPEHDWLTKPLEEISEPPAEPVAPVSLVPPPAPVVPLAVPVSVEPPPAAEAPTVVLPELPVEPAWPGEEEVEPAPAAAAPPVEEAPTEKVPFYKKELSFRRGPKAAQEPKEPKAARPRRERKQQDDASDAKVPFYKRDLSFRRPQRSWDPAEATAEAAATPKAPRKRLSLPSVTLPSLSRGGAKGRVVGLKIGGSQIAAARIHNGETPELVQAVRAGLEHGIVVNGELRDPEALALALKEFFARHKLPKRGVRLGIANNRIGVRTFEVTGIDDPKQLANAIRFRAQEVLPIPLEEAVLDYQVLAEGTTEDGQPLRRVLLVVAYRELVDRYVYACRKAGLQIVGIDLEAFALLRAVAPPHDPVAGAERGALVAVSVGHDRSTFAVSDGRVCEFTRVLEWGGWALNVAIARALDLSPSEVEPLKRALSFVGGDTPPADFDETQLDTAREAARRQLQTFARELVSSLQFYQNQPGSLGIGEIALTGGTAHLPGLGAELERLIGVPVRVVDPLARLRVAKRARRDEQVGSLAVAIGLGIED
jgi:type IV pilus assembly protein PilM